MDYGPIGMIRAILETLGDSLNSEKRKKIGSYLRNSNISSFSPQAMAEACEMAENDPGEQYWKDLFMEKLEADENDREIIAEMLIADYEARHEAEAGQDSETAGDEIQSEIDSEPASDDGGGFDSGRYDGYIG
jgi:hypothetical protein